MSFYKTFTIGLGASQSGLILSAQLVDYNGNNVNGSISTGFFEIGVGTYTWHGLIPDYFEGCVKFSSTSGYTGALASINKTDNQIVPYIIGNVTGGAPGSGIFYGSSNLSSQDNFYTSQYLAFVDPSGNLDGVAGKISNYIGSSKQFTFTPPLPISPASGDRYIIIGRYQ